MEKTEYWASFDFVNKGSCTTDIRVMMINDHNDATLFITSLSELVDDLIGGIKNQNTRMIECEDSKAIARELMLELARQHEKVRVLVSGGEK